MRASFEQTHRFGKEDAYFRTDYLDMQKSTLDFCLGTSVPYQGLRVPIIHRIQFHPFGWGGIQGALENANLEGSLNADSIHKHFRYQIAASIEDAY